MKDIPNGKYFTGPSGHCSGYKESEAKIYVTKNIHQQDWFSNREYREATQEEIKYIRKELVSMYPEIDFPRVTMYPTVEQIKEAAATSPQAEEALKKLFPDVFKVEINIGDIVETLGGKWMIAYVGYNTIGLVGLEKGMPHWGRTVVNDRYKPLSEANIEDLFRNYTFEVIGKVCVSK